MDKVSSKLLKESWWDYMKDNVKSVIEYIIALVISIVPNFIKQINSNEVPIKLSVIITFAIIVLILILKIYKMAKEIKSLKKENYELLNPANENVKKFKPGDTVILKLERDLDNPKKMIVAKILKSEIVCSDENMKLINCVPEQILTKEETDEVLKNIEAKKQRIEIEKQRIEIDRKISQQRMLNRIDELNENIYDQHNQDSEEIWNILGGR